MQTINNEACDHICNSSFVNKNGQLFVPDQSPPEVFWAWASQHWIRNTRHNIDPQPLINQAFYDLSYDIINNLLYASITDYTSSGSINIYDSNN